ncbi:MAG: hypothetical protein ABIJ45_06015, partial [Candidatus Zixiibacteriota bacterium]
MDIITPLVLSLCQKSRLSREESCDVYSQVSYKILKNLNKLKAANKFMQYVRSITVNEIISLYRKSQLSEKAEEQIYKTLYNLKPLNPEEIFSYSK